MPTPLASIAPTPKSHGSLFPDHGIPATNGKSGVTIQDNAAFMAANVAANATGVVTATGAGAQNDIVTTTIAGIAVDATVPATPDTTKVATAISDAINAKAELLGKVTATSAAAVVTIKADNPGLGGNAITVAVSVTGTVTATAPATGKLTGGTVWIKPLENFPIQIGLQTIQLRANRPILANQRLADAITGSGRLYE